MRKAGSVLGAESGGEKDPESQELVLEKHVVIWKISVTKIVVVVVFQ